MRATSPFAKFMGGIGGARQPIERLGISDTDRQTDATPLYAWHTCPQSLRTRAMISLTQFASKERDCRSDLQSLTFHAFEPVPGKIELPNPGNHDLTRAVVEIQ
jgi:hypothetical protein